MTVCLLSGGRANSDFDAGAIDAVAGDLDRVRLVLDCVQAMAAAGPESPRDVLDRIEAMAALAAARLQAITADLDALILALAVDRPAAVLVD